jgi:hypothetical protein
VGARHSDVRRERRERPLKEDMAVRVASISSVEALRVSHKGAEYALLRQEDGACHVPFAYATTLARSPPRMDPAERIPFLRTLRPNQIAPTMVMKLRLSTEGYALNAQGCADGKTTQAYWVVSQLSPRRTLVVTHRVDIAAQWVSEGAECMGFAPWRAEDPEKVPAEARVVVVLVHVMHQLPRYVLRELDLLVVDECDRVAGPVHGRALLLCTPKRVLGLTATPGEMNSPGVDPVVGLIYGLKPILPGARKPFKVVRVLYPFKPVVRQHWYVAKNGQRKLGPDWGVFMNSISCNHERNLDLVRLVRMLLAASAENKVFVFVKYVYHVDALSRVLRHLGMEKNKDFALVYGDEDTTSIRCCRLYVGTSSKGEAGFDERGLKGFDGLRVNHVIFGVDVLDPRQGGGRAFRADMPCIWELLDDHELLREYHAGMRDKWYLENGALSIKTVEMDALDLGEPIEGLEAPAATSRPSSGGRGGRGRGDWRGGRGGRGGTRGGWRGRGGASTYREPP